MASSAGWSSNDPSVVPNVDMVNVLAQPRPQRYIGVQYIKATERQSHYITSRMSRQYDAMIYINITHALETLWGEGLFDEFDSKSRPTCGKAEEKLDR